MRFAHCRKTNIKKIEELRNFALLTYICTVIRLLYPAKYRLKIYETRYMRIQMKKKKQEGNFPLQFMRQKYQQNGADAFT